MSRDIPKLRSIVSMKPIVFTSFLVILLVTSNAVAQELPHFQIVTGDKVRLRSAPSLEAEVLTSLDKGSQVEAIGELTGDWQKVRVKTSGAQGWVHLDFLSEWRISGTDDVESRLADVTSDWEEGLALAGQFSAGTQVTLISGKRTLPATTGAQKNVRNECSGTMLHLTHVSTPAKASPGDFEIGLVGEVPARLLTATPITVADARKSVQARAIANFKGKLEGFTLADTPLMEASAIAAPGGEIHVGVYSSPEKGFTPEVQNKYFSVQFGEQVFVAYIGCTVDPIFFQIGNACYFTYTQSTCETDEYAKFVVRVASDGIRCILVSYAGGC